MVCISMAYISINYGFLNKSEFESYFIKWLLGKCARPKVLSQDTAVARYRHGHLDGDKHIAWSQAQSQGQKAATHSNPVIAKGEGENWDALLKIT